MQRTTNYEKFQELELSEMMEVDGGFDWMDVLDFVIRCTVVVL